jgi:hypothetical protein
MENTIQPYATEPLLSYVNLRLQSFPSKGLFRGVFALFSTT